MTQKIELTFDQALKELESIVRLLEQGDVSLEQAISHYERGMVLKSFCDQALKDAHMRVEKIVETPAGIKTEPFNPAS